MDKAAIAAMGGGGGGGGGDWFSHCLDEGWPCEEAWGFHRGYDGVSNNILQIYNPAIFTCRRT